MKKLSLLFYTMLIILSAGAWVYYFINDLTLSYNDARSHLNISRRVVDSLQPGFTQIGSVWLPLPHILSLPTIWNDFMYRSGLSGSLVSMLAFIGSTLFIGKIVRLLGLDYKAAGVAMLVFALNPNMLFMQTTPMTESLMLFTSLGAIFYFLKWVQFNTVPSLVISGVFVSAAVLTRYDGWFLWAFLSFAVLCISLMKFGRKRAEAYTILFTSLGLFGISLWVLWNWLIFHDPFFFLNGPFSAKAQQDVLLREGRLLTAYNLPLSISTYFLAIKNNASLIVTIMGSVGILAIAFSRLHLAIKIALLSLLVPFAFNVFSLYMGQSVIHLPELPPYTWFNIRYGLMALPVIAIGVGYLVHKKAFATIIVCIIILTQYSLMYINNTIITIEDGVQGSSGYFLDDVGKWLQQNGKDKHILVASSSHDALIFISGLPLKNFITEGTGSYWQESLKKPTRHADLIVMHEGDLVYRELHENTNFKNNYTLVFAGKFSSVYKKNN
jgi:hypothetical protein